MPAHVQVVLFRNDTSRDQSVQSIAASITHEIQHMKAMTFWMLQGSAESNYSQHSSDLSLEEDSESRQRETERHALTMLDKARVKHRYLSRRVALT
jgi:hypothetical protein